MSASPPSADAPFEVSQMTNKEQGAQSAGPRTKKARIALLVCDTPIPAILKQQGDYEAIFTRLFEASRPADVPAFRLDAFDVKKGEYPPESILDEYLGVVLTGSGLSLYSLRNLELSADVLVSKQCI